MRAATSIAVLLCLGACSSPGPRIPDAWELGGQTRANHWGPLVSVGKQGPARFVPGLIAGYDAQHAMDICAAVDEHFREAANDGYNAAIERVQRDLAAAGYGSLNGFSLRIIESDLPGPAWTPLSGRLVLRTSSGAERSLHTFAEPGDRDRCMLPTHAPSAAVSGPAVFSMEDVQPGSILVTGGSLRRSLDEAARRGAVAVLSCALQEICVDPTGRERHLDAIPYGGVKRGTQMAVGFLSPNSVAAIRAAGSGATLDFTAQVRWDERKLQTLVAEIEGVLHPEEVVTIVAHVDEPGACDNATGVAGLAEVARAVAEAVRSGSFLRPRRSLAFVWGVEFIASRTFLDDTQRTPIAGLSSDMTGTSKEQTGAICLLERTPDPGAIVVLPPDEHTPWGAGEVKAEDLIPNGLNVIMRAALVDVGLARRPWETAEHPWEGGSDHDVFLERGVPGLLLWHFTDFAYHTSLDRMDHVDSEELLRTSVALCAAGLAVADAGPEDLKRYLDSLLLERRLRLNMVEQEGAGDDLAALWENWFTGARHWLRRLCLGLDESTDVLPAGKTLPG